MEQTKHSKKDNRTRTSSPVLGATAHHDTTEILLGYVIPAIDKMGTKPSPS